MPTSSSNFSLHESKTMMAQARSKIVTIGIHDDGKTIIAAESIPRSLLERFSLFARERLPSIPAETTTTCSTQLLHLLCGASVGAVKVVVQWMKQNAGTQHVTPLDPPHDFTFTQLLLVYHAAVALKVYYKPYELRNRILRHINDTPLAVEEIALVWNNLQAFPEGNGILNHLLHTTDTFVREGRIAKEDSDATLHFINENPQFRDMLKRIQAGKVRHAEHLAKLAASESRAEARRQNRNRGRFTERKARHEEDRILYRLSMARDGQGILDDRDCDVLRKQFPQRD